MTIYISLSYMCFVFLCFGVGFSWDPWCFESRCSMRKCSNVCWYWAFTHYPDSKPRCQFSLYRRTPLRDNELNIPCSSCVFNVKRIHATLRRRQRLAPKCQSNANLLQYTLDSSFLSCYSSFCWRLTVARKMGGCQVRARETSQSKPTSGVPSTSAPTSRATCKQQSASNRDRFTDGDKKV